MKWYLKRKSKMKVLHIFKKYRPETQGGVEQVITDLCEGANEAGHCSDVFVTGPGSRMTRTTWRSHTVHQAPRNFEIASTPVSIDMVYRFAQVAEGYDLLHFHFPWPFMDILYELSSVKKKYVVTYHSDIIRQKRLLQLYKPLMFRFLNKSSAVVATSSNYLETSPILRKIKSPKHVIPIGIEKLNIHNSNFEFVSSKTEAVIKTGQPFLLFVGVLRYYKGLYSLIEAAHDIRSLIVIAGDGPERNALRSLVEKLKVQNVVFLGKVNDTEKHLLLKNALAFVFPSNERSEAFGVSLLEASAEKLPLISCDIGTGTSFVNLDGQTGFVVPPNSPKALAKAILRLENNSELRDKMGARAYNRFQSRFTKEIMVSNYLSLYRNTLS